MPDFASLCFLSYNRPGFIEEAVRDAVEHAGYPCEVIVHDDGSPDERTRDVLARMLEQGYVSHLILNKRGHNEGVGTAINRMFKIAGGDPVIKLDQDLLFDQGWLARAVGILKQDPAIGMLGFFKYHHEPVRWQDKKVNVPTLGGYHYTRQFCGSAFAIPRRVWERLGPLEEHSDAFAEDIAYMRRVRATLRDTSKWATTTDYFELALPDIDLVHNRGFGIGPSTVVTAPDTVQPIHHEPYILGGGDYRLAEGIPSGELPAAAEEDSPAPAVQVPEPENILQFAPAPSNGKTHPPQIGLISGDAEPEWKTGGAPTAGRRFDVGVVLTMCAGREENIKRTLLYLLDELRIPDGVNAGPIVVVCDGCDPPLDAKFDPADVMFYEIQKHEPGREQPRNVGARLLHEIAPDCNYVWFLDSDMILPADTLEHFYRGLCAAPEDRILIGPYDWLPLGVVGFVPEMRDWEPGVPTVNGMADHRWPSFKEYGPEKVFRHDLGCGLACFGGNLIWPAQAFEEIGGFHPELHHGRCEDGELGLRACERGVPMSLVRDARLWHVWHPVDTTSAIQKNARDVPLLNAMHPWVQNEGLRVVDTDGKRFDWKCPDCDRIFNSLDYWPHAATHRQGAAA